MRNSQRKKPIRILQYPHLKWTFLIAVLAVITLFLSLVLTEPLNSILQNMFAGLVTGVVVSVIGSLKSKAVREVEIEQQFLEVVRKEYRRSLEAYNTYRKKRTTEYEEEIYDLLSELEAVDHYIGNKDKDMRLVRILGKKPSELFEGDGYSLSEQMEKHKRVYDLATSKMSFGQEDMAEIEGVIDAIRRAHRVLNRKVINLQGELFEKKLDIETGVF